MKKTRVQHQRSHSGGFSLIELMIVVAIIGILAAVAYPSYTRYIDKARRADAITALNDAAQRLERCFTQTNSYLDARCTFPATSPDGYYQVVLAPTNTQPNTATFFRLEARRVAGGPQAGDRCGNFWLDSRGDRGVVSAASGVTTADCW